MPVSNREIVQGELYVGYASDESVRSCASSGGVVSAVLIDLLERRIADGALVSRITPSAGRITGVTELARDRTDVLRSAGSSYIDTPVLKSVAQTKDFPGRVAVVGLPCQIRILKRWLSRREELRERISVIIGLFCRGAVRRTFYEDLFARYRIDQSAVESVKVIRGHVKGDVVVSLKNGNRHIIPFRLMNSFRIAGIHALTRCLKCDEHLSREADIAVGDMFTPEFKKRPIKHSSFVCWSEHGVAVMEEMRKRNVIEAEYFGMEKYSKTFVRIERFSNQLGPRYCAASLTGIKMTGGRQTFFNPFRSLAWTILFINSKISKTPRGRRFLYSLPSSVISLEALLVKALSRL